MRKLPRAHEERDLCASLVVVACCLVQNIQ
jgi:hypothetical protein